MSYRWVEHTAELGLDIEASTPAEVFAEAATAFGELVGDEEPGEPATHEVEVGGRDRADLLVAWLEELIFLAETDDFVPERVDDVACDGALRAVVRGRRGRPKHLVKAVTYHGLRFEHAGDAWRAYAVLDV